MNKVDSQNHLSKHTYLHRTVLILLCLVLGSIAYYFLYALPRYNTEKLALERAKLEQSIIDTEAQMNLETEKLEIQNRETQIKEDTNQRQADETNRKLKILNDQKEEIAECDKKVSDYMKAAQRKAVETCGGQSECYISDVEARVISLGLEKCSNLREKYNL